MGFFKRLFGKEGIEEPKPKRVPNYDFDDVDREHALAMRRINREIRVMELQMQKLEAKARLEEVKAELYGEEEDEEIEKSPDDALLNTLLSSVMQGKAQSQQVTPATPFNTVSAPVLSDEQIRQFLSNQNHDKIQQAKQMPKPLLKQYVQSQSGMSDADFERAHKILIEEF